MRKTSLLVLAGIFMAMIVLPVTAFAADTSCKTRYPIVLAHGIAMNDIPGAVEYFNNVKTKLESKGATVFISQVDKIAATGTKAYQFANYLNTQIFSRGYSKVNIIGHSHGGIYTKYAIKFSSYTSPTYGSFSWNLPASRVASLTQIDSPNQGSPVADFALGANAITAGLVGYLGDTLYTDIFGFMFGEGESDVYVDALANAYDLTVDGAYYQYSALGGNSGISGVYCQSYMHKMKSLLCFAVPQIGVIQLLSLTMPIQCNADTINYKRGPHTPSDGVVSEKSAKWANYRGMEDGGLFQIAGIDHCNATGQPYGWTGFFNAPNKYVKIVQDLKGRGY
jgi:triacylglycerol lipase